MVRAAAARPDPPLHPEPAPCRDRAGERGRLPALPLRLAAGPAGRTSLRTRGARCRGRAARRVRGARRGVGSRGARSPMRGIRPRAARHAVSHRAGGLGPDFGTECGAGKRRRAHRPTDPYDPGLSLHPDPRGVLAFAGRAGGRSGALDVRGDRAERVSTPRSVVLRRAGRRIGAPRHPGRAGPGRAGRGGPGDLRQLCRVTGAAHPLGQTAADRRSQPPAPGRAVRDRERGALVAAQESGGRREREGIRAAGDRAVRQDSAPAIRGRVSQAAHERNPRGSVAGDAHGVPAARSPR